MAEPARVIFDGASALDVADWLLVAAARGRGSILLEPAGDLHSVMVERDAVLQGISWLMPALGDAVCARLAFVAGLELATAREQLGRAEVRVGREDVELLIAVRLSQSGLGVELERISAQRESVPEPKVTADANRIGIYKVVGELGRGGMGVVYRGEHEALAKPVAIKVLYAQMAQDPEMAGRFVREARAASRIRHPGIVDVTDFGTLPDGRGFLVMELVEGITLADVMANGALLPARAVAFAHQIATALEAAHERGVVHRDLKPANVFVDENEQVKIGDFGAAKVVESTTEPSDTQRGTIFGTPFYMSPEHARGLETDPRSDIYSLGCVFYEMISGKVPYDGQTALDVLSQHITALVPPIRSPHGPLPELLEHVIRRAMAKRVEERYQSARELLNDLTRLQTALGRAGWRKWLPV